MNDNQSKLIGFLPGYISWFTIVLAILTIVTFFAVSDPRVQYATRMGTGMMEPSGGSVSVSPSVGGPMMGRDASGVYYPYPYPNPEVPVTDTREFLKTYYNASMRTRDVQTLTRRVETTVRGHEGRIDSQSSSEKYGYVSFALPQSKYDTFRLELESLVGSRFLKVNITSQNLLSEKVSIEEQQKRADTALADYKSARQKIVNSHANAVQSLQAKIDASTAELTQLQGQPATPQILAQIQSVSDERTSLKQQLASENASYTAQISYADANIKYAQDWQKAVKTQDQTLLANVATVNGTVSIVWISLWEMALLYLPGYWIPTIFSTLTALSFLRDRRRLAFSL